LVNVSSAFGRPVRGMPQSITYPTNFRRTTLGEAALMDMDDLEHNTRDGLHIASLAGSWIALVAGFGGLRGRGNTVSFTPNLPDALARLAFTIAFQTDGCT
jgi:trehalose/maltose hydrolase-like predicted phosphorylase